MDFNLSSTWRQVDQINIRSFFSGFFSFGGRFIILTSFSTSRTLNFSSMIFTANPVPIALVLKSKSALACPLEIFLPPAYPGTLNQVSRRMLFVIVARFLETRFAIPLLSQMKLPESAAERPVSPSSIGRFNRARWTSLLDQGDLIVCRLSYFADQYRNIRDPAAFAARQRRSPAMIS